MSMFNESKYLSPNMSLQVLERNRESYDHRIVVVTTVKSYLDVVEYLVVI